MAGLGYWYDSDGNKSYGRVASGYCVVAAVACFVAGIMVPTLAGYCLSAMSAFLWSAAGFYGTSKGQQAVKYVVGGLSHIKAFKSGAAVAPSPEEK